MALALTRSMADSNVPSLIVDEGSTFVLNPSAPGIHKRHTWTIRNIGSTPIKLRTHFTSDRSGFSLWLGQEHWIEPGEAFPVSLTWSTPNTEACPFSRLAEIWTSDPDRPKVKFKVVGKTARNRRSLSGSSLFRD